MKLVKLTESTEELSLKLIFCKNELDKIKKIKDYIINNFENIKTTGIIENPENGEMFIGLILKK